MAAFVDNFSLDVSERNLMAITLNIHTKTERSEICTCKRNRVFRRDCEPSRIPEATLKRLRRGEGN